MLIDSLEQDRALTLSLDDFKGEGGVGMSYDSVIYGGALFAQTDAMLSSGLTAFTASSCIQRHGFGPIKGLLTFDRVSINKRTENY